MTNLYTASRRLSATQTIREVEQSLRTVRRDVDHLQRRIGPTIPLAVEAGELVGPYIGPFEYDYLVDQSWSTLGAEGQEFTTFHGHPFRVYSTIQGAVNDIGSISGSHTFSVLVVGGTYDESVDQDQVARGHPIVWQATQLYRRSGQVVIQAQSGGGPAFKADRYSSNTFRGFRFAPAGSSDYAFETIGSPRNEFVDCVFSGTFEGALAECDFTRCWMNGADIGDFDSINGCNFVDCIFEDMVIGGGGIGHTQILGCSFDNAYIVFNGGACGNVKVDGNSFGPTAQGSVPPPSIDFGDDTGLTVDIERILVTNNTFEQQPPDNGEMIRFRSVNPRDPNNNKGGFMGNIVINSNTFIASTLRSGVVYIRSTNPDWPNDWHSVSVVGNTFRPYDGTPSWPSTPYLVPFTVVEGLFNASTFGPNTPAAFVRYNVSGEDNEFFPAIAAIGSSSGALTTGETEIFFGSSVSGEPIVA